MVFRGRSTHMIQCVMHTSNVKCHYDHTSFSCKSCSDRALPFPRSDVESHIPHASVTLVPAFIPTSILSTVLPVQFFTTPSISSLRTLHPSTPNSNISSNRSTCNLVSICASVIFPLVGRHATTKFGKSASSGWERSSRGCVRCKPIERDVV